MQKENVEQLLIIVKSGEEEAFNMKVYKDGTLCRQGCGGLPSIGISAMSFTGSSTLFDNLMERIPQQVLDNPVNYQDETIATPLEYILAFYGVSSNGDTGEHAAWTQSTGIRFLLDTNTSFRHPLLAFVDGFVLEAAEQSNSWYFDVIIKAVYKLTSTILPDQTMIAVPKTGQGIQTNFENYVNQVRSSSRKWDLVSFAKDKYYIADDGTQFRPDIAQDRYGFTFNFVPVYGAEEPKKKRWKLW